MHNSSSTPHNLLMPDLYTCIFVLVLDCSVSQVLTRRPVSVIHNDKGHDPSSIADVHYSPDPTHEELPSPGVDHSPRGFPVGTAAQTKLKPVGPHSPNLFGGPLKRPGYGFTITRKFGVAIQHPAAS